MHQILVGRLGLTTEAGTYRILVDRLWPRGVSKVGVPWDQWVKEIAPSTALRQWYGHEIARYEEFRKAYWQELLAQREGQAIQQVWERVAQQPIALLTASRILETSQVPILREFLLSTEEE